uniref:Uncharacterized protein n=1 Tax=Panagrolaimus sp. PS1159 TaxID=55785 RepID=A0AC35GTY2_9BILA
MPSSTSSESSSPSHASSSSLPSSFESKSLDPPLLSSAAVLKQTKKCNGCDKNARNNSCYCSNSCWLKKEIGEIISSKIILESHLRSANIQCRHGFSNP